MSLLQIERFRVPASPGPIWPVSGPPRSDTSRRPPLGPNGEGSKTRRSRRRVRRRRTTTISLETKSRRRRRRQSRPPRAKSITGRRRCPEVGLGILDFTFGAIAKRQIQKSQTDLWTPRTSADGRRSCAVDESKTRKTPTAPQPQRERVIQPLDTSERKFKSQDQRIRGSEDQRTRGSEDQRKLGIPKPTSGHLKK